MNRRKFITVTAVAAVVPSFISTSFDPDEIDNKPTASHDHLLVVCKGQKLQLLGDDYIDPWDHVEMLEGANVQVGDVIYEVAQTPTNYSDNIMFVPTFKLGESRIK
jgi:hypothetical protein